MTDSEVEYNDDDTERPLQARLQFTNYLKALKGTACPFLAHKFMSVYLYGPGLTGMI